MSKPTTVREVLLAAAELIKRDGWCQRWFRHPSGRHCLLGATWDVPGGGMSRAGAAARDRLKGLGYDIVWNDAPGRTKAQVLAALRRAARGKG